MHRKDITVEIIEDAGYIIYAGDEKYSEGRVWSEAREWKTGRHNATVKHEGKFLKLFKHNKGYLMVILYIKGRKYNFLMHRLIAMKYLGAVKEQQIDHYDHNRSNNKLDNIRLVTSQQNKFNKSKHKNCSSKYKGVSFFKRDGKWQARIGYNKKTIHLGLFDNEIDAAKAYDRVAKKLYGKYKYLNFI